MNSTHSSTNDIPGRPVFIESIQVKASLQAGVFITMSGADGRAMFAPLSNNEAVQLARDLAKAVAAYRNAGGLDDKM